MFLENDCKKNGGVFQRILHKKVDHSKDSLRIHPQSGAMFVKKPAAEAIDCNCKQGKELIMLEARQQTCDKCDYYLQTAPGSGECRRCAPSPNRTIFVTRSEATGAYKTDVHWPKVYDSNWCGEFKPKGKP
jgi:hypothetical protein